MPKGYARAETPEEQEDRFWGKVDASGDCWSWSASVGSHGYGQFRVWGDRTMVTAHRMAWTILVGPVPEGMTLDHLCRNRRCVNPDHLEVVTRGENIRRGYSPSTMARQSGVCGRGHSEWYTRPGPEGHRRCRTCSKAMARAWRVAHPKKS